MRLTLTCGFLSICLSAVLCPALANGQSPLATDPYVPLTVEKKAKIFAIRTIAPSSLLKSAVAAGISHWKDSPEEWHQGVTGYGHRFGHRMATRGVENGIGFVVASALHEDPRYFYLSQGTVGQRVGHGLKSAILTRTDNGGWRPSIWRVTSNYGAQFVSNAWRPESEHGVGDTLVRGTLSIGYDAAFNVFKEFWPDIRRKVFRR